MNALQGQQGQQKAYGDQHTKKLQPMLAEQQVHVLDHEKKVWFKGRIISRSDDRSHLIKTEGGCLIHRNQRHLQEETSVSNKPTVTTEHSPPKPVDTVPQERNAEMLTVPVVESVTPPMSPDTMPREQSEAET